MGYCSCGNWVDEGDICSHCGGGGGYDDTDEDEDEIAFDYYKYYIDMQSIIKDNLIEIGITNIIDTNICTYCNHNIYHSYRYNHTDKRNILLAMIKE